VRAIARTGLHFTENPYDRERYERLLALTAREYAAVAQLTEAAVLERFRADVGYCTTKVGADGVIVGDDERLLLVRRADDNCWSLVAGWVEPGEDPRHTIVREFREETGLDVVVDDLVGVMTRRADAGHGPHGMIGVVFLCSIVGGEPRPLEHEVLEIAWRHVDDVDSWHKTHEQWARAALARWHELR
jgi:ADP-ribose pyrophosphatase YjhB (NUDIX family)